jgi:hypothetical protein
MPNPARPSHVLLSGKKRESLINLRQEVKRRVEAGHICEVVGDFINVPVCPRTKSIPERHLVPVFFLCRSMS